MRQKTISNNLTNRRRLTGLLLIVTPFLLGGSCGEETAPPAPTAPLTWQAAFGGILEDQGLDVERVAGGYVAAGWSSSFGPGAEDAYLVKADDAGNMLWEANYGGSATDIARALVVADDGGLVAAGVTSSSGLGGMDMYMFKTAANGSLLWEKTFGGVDDDEAFGLLKTADGGYLVVGSSVTFGGGTLKTAYLVKTDAAGTLQWQTSYTFPGTDFIGYDVIPSGDGGYLIIGESVPVVVGWSEVYLARVDSAGGVIWERSFGGQVNDRGNGIVSTSDGGFVIVGTTTSFGAVGEDIYVLRTNSVGDSILWQRTFGGAGADRGEAVSATADGGFIISGTKTLGVLSGSQAYLLKIDGSGALVWDRSYGGSAFEDGSGMALSTDGGYVIVGATTSIGAGSEDLYLVKTDASGVLNLPGGQ
ncbi:MAG: hypothetical protein ACE5GA_03440 [Candidatus Zixiibacteriota bacterium]